MTEKKKSDSSESEENKSPKENTELTPAEDIEKIISAEVPDIFKNLSTQNKKKLVKAASHGAMVVAMQKMHSGPLPDPETLRAYAEIIPNGAERVMAMAEENQKHCHYMDKGFLDGQLKMGKRGQTYGFIIGMTVIILGCLLIYLGHEGAGTTTILSGVGGLVAAFIIGRRIKKS